MQSRREREVKADPQPSKGMEARSPKAGQEHHSHGWHQHGVDVPHSKPQREEENNPENHRKIWQSPGKPGKGDASAAAKSCKVFHKG